MIESIICELLRVALQQVNALLHCLLLQGESCHMQ